MAQSTVVAITVINVIANFFVIRKKLIYILKLIQLCLNCNQSCATAIAISVPVSSCRGLASIL